MRLVQQLLAAASARNLTKLAGALDAPSPIRDFLDVDVPAPAASSSPSNLDRALALLGNGDANTSLLSEALQRLPGWVAEPGLAASDLLHECLFADADRPFVDDLRHRRARARQLLGASFGRTVHLDRLAGSASGALLDTVRGAAADEATNLDGASRLELGPLLQLLGHFAADDPRRGKITATLFALANTLERRQLFALSSLVSSAWLATDFQSGALLALGHARLGARDLDGPIVDAADRDRGDVDVVTYLSLREMAARGQAADALILARSTLAMLTQARPAPLVQVAAAVFHMETVGAPPPDAAEVRSLAGQRDDWHFGNYALLLLDLLEARHTQAAGRVARQIELAGHRDFWTVAFRLCRDNDWRVQALRLLFGELVRAPHRVALWRAAAHALCEGLTRQLVLDEIDERVAAQCADGAPAGGGSVLDGLGALSAFLNPKS